MGAIGGMLGFGGGASGSGFANPSGANLMGTTNPQEIANAYTGTQGSMLQQQALLQALQAQQGLQNQSNVYNQLQGIATGQGPNPAQAQYQQNIQDLAKQQAGAIASTKGISPALQARLISQQGSSAMQNAAGQGAANLANQQLGALGMSGALANQQAAQQLGQTNINAQTQLAEQGNILGATGTANQQAVNMQSNINNANAGLAGNQMGAQQNMFQGATGALGMGIGGGFGKGLGTAFGAAAAHGGVVEDGTVNDYAAGGKVRKEKHNIPAILPQIPLSPAPGAYIQEYLRNWKPSGSGLPLAQEQAQQQLQAQPMAKGGKVHAMVSPGEGYIPPNKLKEVKKGKNPLSVAEKFPGKPKVPGDSYENDVIPKDLKEGGIVIPNHVMQSKNPSKEAMRFVEAILAAKKKAK